MTAGARFVALLGADEDDRVVVRGRTPVDDALCARRWFAAHHADGGELVHAFGHREQRRHRAERLAAEIQVQPGADDAPTFGCQMIDDARQIGVEELRLIDADDRGVGGDASQQFHGRGNRRGVDAAAVVRAHLIDGVTIVDGRLEHLYLLARDHRAPQPANQLFALAAEHAAADDFDAALSFPWWVNRCCVHRSFSDPAPGRCFL